MPPVAEEEAEIEKACAAPKVYMPPALAKQVRSPAPLRFILRPGRCRGAPVTPSFVSMRPPGPVARPEPAGNAAGTRARCHH